MARPRLRPGVRVVYDHVRDRYALLHPEGVRFLNDTAAAVLRECDGSRTVEALVERLGRSYEGVSTPDVQAMLSSLADSRLLEVADD